MKVSKAIEILTIASEAENFKPDQDFRDALKLSIAALERVELHRIDRRYPFNTSLPGETPEDE